MEPENLNSRPVKKPIGYAWLIGHLDLDVRPPVHQTALGTMRRELKNGPLAQLELPSPYAVPEELGAQLEFALKWDGVDLHLLNACFQKLRDGGRAAELADHIRGRPTGANTRRLWFLYEWLTGERLDLEDARTGNYVPLLDERYVGAKPVRSRRHRVNDNLLGNRDFCPVVHRASDLPATDALRQEAAHIVDEFDADALHRALSYLYTKETMTSFRLEGERPSASKAERFVQLLRSAGELVQLDKATLIRVQNQIVERPFADVDYCLEQRYVGENIDLMRQRIHFIAPKPNDLPSLMAGWFACLDRMAQSSVDAVVQAAVASFGFVFIHPFQDGNGRLHRLLIHAILSRTGFTPKGVILPVSAVMLARRHEYDAVLETFSKPLLSLIDYDEDEAGQLTVQGDTADLYRFFDASPMVEGLARWLDETIRTEFRNELEFVVRYREVRQAMDEVVDLPIPLANLFVRLCLQNEGRLARGRREKHFSMLSEEQITGLEEALQPLVRGDRPQEND